MAILPSSPDSSRGESDKRIRLFDQANPLERTDATGG